MHSTVCNVQKHVLSEIDTFTVDIHTGLLLFDSLVMKLGLRHIIMRKRITDYQ